MMPQMAIVKTRQMNQWHHLPAISYNEQGIRLGWVQYHIGGGGVQYICLVGCKSSPQVGCATVCLVLIIEVYGILWRL